MCMKDKKRKFVVFNAGDAKKLDELAAKYSKKIGHTVTVEEYVRRKALEK